MACSYAKCLVNCLLLNSETLQWFLMNIQSPEGHLHSASSGSSQWPDLKMSDFPKVTSHKWQQVNLWTIHIPLWWLECWLDRISVDTSDGDQFYSVTTCKDWVNILRSPMPPSSADIFCWNNSLRSRDVQVNMEAVSLLLIRNQSINLEKQ